MSRYWVSWWEPDEAAHPATEGVINEWCSGHRWRSYVDRRDVREASMVALVTAESDGQAQYIIEAARTVIEWRFRNAGGSEWTPGDRFPMP